jgi:hypothetical protein
MTTKPLTIPNGIGLGNETLSTYDEGTWVPTVANLTVGGDGILTGFYTRIGRLVTATIRFVHGTGSSISGIIVCTNLPFTAARYTAGTLFMTDSGVKFYIGAVQVDGASATLRFATAAADGWLDADSPFTWGVNDNFTATISYEV